MHLIDVCKSNKLLRHFCLINYLLTKILKTYLPYHKCFHRLDSITVDPSFFRSLRGAVIKLLALSTRGREFDPGVLQYLDKNLKPMPCLRVSIAVGGMYTITTQLLQITRHSKLEWDCAPKGIRSSYVDAS